MHSLLVFGVALIGAIQSTNAASAGCGKAPPSSGTKSMTVNGKSRQYILQLPSNYDSSKPHRLIFAYHWLNGSMNTVVDGQYYGLRPIAGDSTIFVAPNGLSAGWGNAGGEDITFTDQMLDSVKTSLCIDEGQIFATGWSYGGAMSFSVACSRPTVFKAVAVIAGAQLSGCSGGTTPVPYLGIHGAADNVLAISQGRQLRDKFLGLNGCASKNAPEPSAGQSGHIKTEYACRANQPVTWIAHGGGHVPDPSDNGQKWAPGETWSFFNSIGGGGSSTTSRPGSTTAGPGTTATTSNPPQPTGNCGAKFDQCGGLNWQGATCCQSGSTCKFSNDWYSQCL